jgi:hypothetical protein
MSEWQYGWFEIGGKRIEGAGIKLEPYASKGSKAVGVTRGKYTVQAVLHPMFWPTLVLAVWAEKALHGAKQTRAIRREVRKARRAISGWHGRWMWEVDQHARTVRECRPIVAE